MGRLSAVTSSRRTPIRALLTTLVSAALLLVPRAAAAQKTDTLVLRNGDRIIGEATTMTNGLLEYKTDNVGTINVKWTHVSRLTSQSYFSVETRSRQRFYGSLIPADSAGYLAVALEYVHLVALPDVVELTRIKQTSVFSRIDGYLDLGFSYAKSNKTVQLTSTLDAKYLLEYWGVYLKGDIFLQSQEGDGGTPTRRWSVQPSVQRDLGKGWVAYLVGQLQANKELNLDLRTLGSPGVGHHLFRSNAHQAVAFLGLAAQRERYTDTTATGNKEEVTSLAASLGGQYRAFRYDSPELDLSATLEVYPSLTELGRVRTEGDLRTRYEAIKSLFITLAFQISADNRPPSKDTPKSDFTTTLSLTWKF
jgi:hypothetical protein